MVIVRNSGYADFAGELMPTGNGSIVAVFNSYNGTPQLLIRDPSDVESMTGTRCNPIGNYNLISIADLRAQFTGASTLADGKIRGIVISDNTSGQWQNQNLVVQEANGSGITIRFTTAHSYMMNDYVEVKVGGGTLEEYNGLLQVNNLDLCRASQLINSGNISITPRVATVTDILANGDNWESTLVNVQNADLSGGTTYGDFGVMLNDATGSIAMFSGFANFGATALPTGTGDVTAVVGDYNATQLNIRNLDDVNITGSGGGGGGGGGGGSEAPISDIRAMFASGTTTVPASTTIAGIVISDKDQGNITARNIVIQNTAGSGIVVRFDNDNTTIAMGDSVTIDVSGGTLSEYNGLLQISNLPNTTASIISSGNNLTPRVTTVTDILANSENWESTLIKVMSVNIVGSTTYSGVTTVDDGSDSIDLYTRSAATFSANPLPGGQVDVTAIVSQFNTPQINLRTINDVQ
jgi:phosphohistidine swiveling domain-containing protein